jgi:hypothetical protein
MVVCILKLHQCHARDSFEVIDCPLRYYICLEENQHRRYVPVRRLDNQATEPTVSWLSVGHRLNQIAKTEGYALNEVLSQARIVI